MYKGILIIMVWVYTMHDLNSQSNVSIQGRIRDAYSHSSLNDGRVNLIGGDRTSFDALTDSTGIFKLSNIPAGRYEIQINAKGYQSQWIKDYLIGRTNVPMLFELVPISNELPEVVISDRKNGIFISPLSNALVVTREETERLPAGFFDPARLFTSQSGISSMNDGANHLIIRGNNPAFVKWMIHGTEILNPNHLSNAGTFNDQASPSGGGVNMISASVLDNTYLYKNPAPAMIGNALAGALDLNLRNGNTEKLTTEAQISLLGMEVGLEGPLSKHGASFITRYRYSTVGLLSQFGVQFGDESISYQDVMVNASFPSKHNDLAFFLFTGNNANDFAGKKDSTQRVIDKEKYDIKFKGGQLITGLTYESKGNSKNRFLADVIYSENKSSHRIDVNIPTSNEENHLNLLKLNIHPRVISLFGNHKIWTTGFQFQSNKDQVNLFKNDLQLGGSDNRKSYFTVQPYSNYLIEGEKFSFQGGVHSMASKAGFSIEPRLQFLFHPTKQNSFQFDLGKYSQVYHNILEIELMKSFQSQLSFQHQGNQYRWKIETYFQHHYGIPTNQNFSLLNESPNPGYYFLQSYSKGNIYGIESSLNGNLGKWKYNTNLSIFRSKFSSSLIKESPTRFDQSYLFHGSIGREWEKQKSNYKKLFGWYSAIQSGGAMKDTPIDFVNGVPTIRTNALYSITRPGLYRLDMRIYRRKFYKNLNTMLALDIQNLTGQQNFSYSYYDYTKKAVTFNYQLGILPNLSFTIEY